MERVQKEINLFSTGLNAVFPPDVGGRMRTFHLLNGLPVDYRITYLGVGKSSLRISNGKIQQIIKPISLPAQYLHYLLCLCIGKAWVSILTTLPILAFLCPGLFFSIKRGVKKSKVSFIDLPFYYSFINKFKDKLLIYNSHNFEYEIIDLWLLNRERTFIGKIMAKLITRLEEKACKISDLVLVPSQAVKDGFIKHYNVAPQKIHILPNGVRTDLIRPCSLAEKEKAKNELGVGNKRTVIFIGSAFWPPNVDAARFIIEELSWKLPDYIFLIMGGVKNSFETENPVIHDDELPVNDGRGFLFTGWDCPELSAGRRACRIKRRATFFIKDKGISEIFLEAKTNVPAGLFFASSLFRWPRIGKTAFRLKINGEICQEFNLNNLGSKKISSRFGKKLDFINATIEMDDSNRACLAKISCDGMSVSSLGYISNGKKKLLSMSPRQGIPPRFLYEAHVKQKNVLFFGEVTDSIKELMFKASDIALNPVLQGSGTNIKMFDYMAAGIPIVTTPLGARGIEGKDGSHYIVCGMDQFADKIKTLFDNPNLKIDIIKNACNLVEDKYDCQKISNELDLLIKEYIN
ncbi:MAG: glycosyltransferase [bacterium]|nr:glycosyltransferase [bacterium]